MVALALNGIVGSGIFGLPALLAGLLGGISPVAVVVGGAAAAIIMACHAEVAARFNASGGTYLYLQTAFGRLAGLTAAWLMLLSRLTACAGSVNLMISYLAQLWPAAELPAAHLALVTTTVGAIALINIAGVIMGVRLGNVTVVAKLGALTLVIAAAVPWVWHHGMVSTPATHAGAGSWLDAMLLLLFAYGGFETALNPLGEARDPRRDAPFALFVALLVVVLIYSSLQAVVMGVLPAAASSTRPLADAARLMMGPAGATLVSVGAIVSISGFLGANLLAMPRLMYALAARGDFPSVFARVSRSSATPWVSIAAFATGVWGCALAADFARNVTLSAVARLVYYAALCAAVPVLRRREAGSWGLRIPFGPLVPGLGILICVALATRAGAGDSLILICTVSVALLNWVLARRRAGSGTPAAKAADEVC